MTALRFLKAILTTTSFKTLATYMPGTNFRLAQPHIATDADTP